MKTVLLTTLALTLAFGAVTTPVVGSGRYPFFVEAGVPSLEGGVMVLDIDPDPELPGYWPNPLGVGWTLPANRQVIHIHRGDRGADIPDLQLGGVVTLSEDWEGSTGSARFVVEGESFVPYTEEDRLQGHITVENYPEVYGERVVVGPMWALVTCHPDSGNPVGMVVKYLLELE